MPSYGKEDWKDFDLLFVYKLYGGAIINICYF